ncbi:restriction endonuclease fold toxin-2 domain-containing protein [Cellulomonas iranensis]|uniref:restriction endonuclease fold toxin-2 domain-containing protein n=1 Tax=Cellulomonas iranensis TaxID=76862 RepID=UPI0011778165|nr:restriction endonuclease fold toxin-2 domain-containing protein [Cellulomonas iranensis]
MSATAVEDPVAVPPREWWQVWAQRRSQWWVARPVLAARWARVRAMGLWVALTWVLLLLLVVPDLRLAVRGYLGAVWLVVAWWVLARTKTLTWAGYMRYFAGCVTWSFMVAAVCTVVALRVASTAGGSGPTVMIASLSEEALKLVPVAVVALLAPRRARRFAAVDWLLLGWAAGTAFVAVEEAARRTALMVTTSGMMTRFWSGGEGVPPDWVQLGWSLVPNALHGEIAAYGGHGVLTATVTGAVGVGVGVWRWSRRRGDAGGAIAGAVALLAPLLALWVAIADHGGLNVQVDAGALSPDGTPRWLDPAVTSVPWWVRVPWSALGHGHGRVAFVVLVAVMCTLLDAHRLRSLRAPGLVRAVAPSWAGRGWKAGGRGRAARLLEGIAAALTWWVWVVVRDVTQMVAAFARQPDEPRRVAVLRGQDAAAAQRAARELAYDTLAGTPTRSAVLRAQALAGTALGLLLVLALGVAPAAAARFGPYPWDLQRYHETYDASWLAGLIEDLGRWWHDQPMSTQLLIGLGIAALVTLSGGSLAFAFGISGVLTWGLDKSGGIATFLRDPQRATRDYVLTATPAQVAADTLGVALTLAPANFAGAAIGRGVRTVAKEVAADPGAWLASRRALFADGSDVGVIDMEWLLARKPVPLGDGSVQLPLSAADEAAAVARYEALPHVPLSARGDELQYQLRVYGDNERVVELAEGRTLPDGFTSTYGAVGDAKYVAPGSGSSFYEPAVGSKLEEVATRVMDKRLLRLAEAASRLGDTGVIEYVTNSPAAARFFEDRMIALGLRGYVRLVP